MALKYTQSVFFFPQKFNECTLLLNYDGLVDN